LAFYLQRLPYRPTLLVDRLSIVSTLGLLVFSLCALIFTKNGRNKAILRSLPFIFVLCNAFIIFRLTAPVDPTSLYYAGNPYFQKIISNSHTNDPADVRIISPYSPQTNLYYGLATLNGYDSVYSKNIENFIHAVNYPQATFQLSSGPHGSHNAIYIGNTSKTDLLENLGIQYIIGLANKSINEYTKIYQVNDDEVAGQEYALFKANTLTPQIYFANSVVDMTHNEQLQAIKQNSLIYHQIAVAGVHQSISASLESKVSYSIDIDKISITTTSNQARYLLVGQTYDSQWQATIDGHIIPVKQADYNFMALDVPAGEHQILMTYKPMTFTEGLTLSIAALAITFGYIGYNLVGYRSITKVKPSKRK
jgi:hypothetical protein